MRVFSNQRDGAGGGAQQGERAVTRPSSAGRRGPRAAGSVPVYDPLLAGATPARLVLHQGGELRVSAEEASGQCS